MQIGKIAHAGIVASTKLSRVIMDPLLYNSFDAGSYVLEPKILVNFKNLKTLRFDALVVSHAHYDHFCPQSLKWIDRDTPFIFPYGEDEIEFCAKWMGFKNRKGLKPFEQLKIKDLTMTATPSYAPFPEMGVVFGAGGRTCWNSVDTGIELSTIKRIKKEVGAIDLFLATFQPLVEKGLVRDSLGTSFPYEKYGEFLRNVFRVDARCAIPSSCGVRSAWQGWINDRQFPITEMQFMSDIQKVRPKMHLKLLNPGDVINIGKIFSVQTKGLSFVKGAQAAPFDWRPDRGVPELKDFLAKGKRTMKEALKFLDEQFISLLLQKRHNKWVAVLQKNKILWRLEVIGEGDLREVRHIDFSESKIRWHKKTIDDFVHIHTSVTASAISGFIDGSLSSSAIFGGGHIRKFRRLYRPTVRGLKPYKLPQDEPLSTVLMPFVDLRYTLAEIKRDR